MESTKPKRGYFIINNKKYSVCEGINTIGRNKEATVIIADTSVSQHQAMLIIIGDKHYLSDFKSSNGTFLRSVKLEPMQVYEVKHGATVKFAAISGAYFKVQDSAEENTQINNSSQLIDDSVYNTKTQIYEIDSFNNHGYARVGYQHTNGLMGNSFNFNEDILDLGVIPPDTRASNEDTDSSIHGGSSKENACQTDIISGVNLIKEELEAINDLPTQILEGNRSTDSQTDFDDTDTLVRSKHEIINDLPIEIFEKSDCNNLQSISIHELPTQLLTSPLINETASKLSTSNCSTTEPVAEKTNMENSNITAANAGSNKSICEDATSPSIKGNSHDINTLAEINERSCDGSRFVDDSVRDDCASSSVKIKNQSDVIDETLCNDDICSKNIITEDENSSDSIDFITMQSANRSFCCENPTAVDSDTQSNLHVSQCNRRASNTIRSDIDSDTTDDEDYSYMPKCKRKFNKLQIRDDSDSETDVDVDKGSNDELPKETDEPDLFKNVKLDAERISDDSGSDTDVEMDVVTSNKLCDDNVSVNDSKLNDSDVIPPTQEGVKCENKKFDNVNVEHTNNSEVALGDSFRLTLTNTTDVDFHPHNTSEDKAVDNNDSMLNFNTASDGMLSKSDAVMKKVSLGEGMQEIVAEDCDDSTQVDVSNASEDDRQKLEDKKVCFSEKIDEFEGASGVFLQPTQKLLEICMEGNIVQVCHDNDKDDDIFLKPTQNFDGLQSANPINEEGDDEDIFVQPTQKLPEDEGNASSGKSDDVFVHPHVSVAQFTKETLKFKSITKTTKPVDVDEILEHPRVDGSEATQSVDAKLAYMFEATQVEDDDMFSNATQKLPDLKPVETEAIFLEPTQKFENQGSKAQQANDELFLQPTQVIVKEPGSDGFLKSSKEASASTAPESRRNVEDDDIFFNATQKLRNFKLVETEAIFLEPTQNFENKGSNAQQARDELSLQPTHVIVNEPQSKSFPKSSKAPSASTFAGSRRKIEDDDLFSNATQKLPNLKPVETESIFLELTQNFENQEGYAQQAKKELFSKPTQVIVNEPQSDGSNEASASTSAESRKSSRRNLNLSTERGEMSEHAQNKQSERTRAEEELFMKATQVVVANQTTQAAVETIRSTPVSVESQFEVMFASQNVYLPENTSLRPTNPLLSVLDTHNDETQDDVHPAVQIVEINVGSATDDGLVIKEENVKNGGMSQSDTKPKDNSDEKDGRLAQNSMDVRNVANKDKANKVEEISSKSTYECSDGDQERIKDGNEGRALRGGRRTLQSKLGRDRMDSSDEEICSKREERNVKKSVKKSKRKSEDSDDSSVPPKLAKATQRPSEDKSDENKGHRSARNKTPKLAKATQQPSEDKSDENKGHRSARNKTGRRKNTSSLSTVVECTVVGSVHIVEGKTQKVEVTSQIKSDISQSVQENKEEKTVQDDEIKVGVRRSSRRSPQADKNDGLRATRKKGDAKKVTKTLTTVEEMDSESAESSELRVEGKVSEDVLECSRIMGNAEDGKVEEVRFKELLNEETVKKADESRKMKDVVVEQENKKGDPKVALMATANLRINRSESCGENAANSNKKKLQLNDDKEVKDKKGLDKKTKKGTRRNDEEDETNSVWKNIASSESDTLSKDTKSKLNKTYKTRKDEEFVEKLASTEETHENVGDNTRRNRAASVDKCTISEGKAKTKLKRTRTNSQSSEDVSSMESSTDTNDNLTTPKKLRSSKIISPSIETENTRSVRSSRSAAKLSTINETGSCGSSEAQSKKTDSTSEDEFVASVPKRKRKNVFREDDEDTPRQLAVSVPSPPSRRRPSHLQDSVLSTPERNKRKLKPKVVFTMLDSPELESAIRSLGGGVVDTVEACTVLVTGSVKRSQKLLVAVGQGKPICSPSWLQESKKIGSFLDPWDFILTDGEAEKKWQFSLKESLQRSTSKKLLENYAVQLVVSNAQDVLKGAVEACGGKCVTRAPPKSSPASYVIVSTAENKSKYAKFLKQNPRPVIVAAEAIFDGVLRQELRFESHLLT